MAVMPPDPERCVTTFQYAVILGYSIRSIKRFIFAMIPDYRNPFVFQAIHNLSQKGFIWLLLLQIIVLP